jgi:hypothetical protein
MQPETPSDPEVEQRMPVGAASMSVVRETLTGDRTCTTCFHPLIGRAIEREPNTGLLYVRCGECGTATALAEYPTAAPWIRRIKAVVAAGLIASMIGAVLLLAGFGGGFATIAAVQSAENAGRALHDVYLHNVSTAVDPQSMESWGPADTPWLAKPEGMAALHASRFSVEAAEPLIVIFGLGLVPIIPLSILIGGATMRRGVLLRMIVTAAPVVIGCLLIAVPTVFLNPIPAGTPTWRQFALHANIVFFLLITCPLYAAIAALAAATAPLILSLCARAVLPPGDRRLVAWIWEWRGKPVPRDR